MLSPIHPVGRFKAKYFNSIGFDESNADQLKKSLLEIAYSNEIKEEITSSHGVKYIVEGSVETPTGKVAKLQTIWIIDLGQNRPRFVTAYPV